MNTKQPYATLPHVAEFTQWLTVQLESETKFNHSYVDRRSGAKWTCTSLYTAFTAYNWNHPGNKRLSYNPGSSSASNDIALNALRSDLIAAGIDDQKMLNATLDIMAWGGVSARNAKWLSEHRVGLGRMVRDVAAAINLEEPDSPTLTAKALRFNSGMTKVYALLCPDFVIYDSRVAAALGLLVVRFCQEHKLSTVPAGLAFPWAAAKESATSVAPKRRNPSTGSLKFKGLRSGSHHALWNIRASWVLSQAVKALASDNSFRSGQTIEQSLRNVEKGLFAIGYDLPLAT